MVIQHHQRMRAVLHPLASATTTVRSSNNVAPIWMRRQNASSVSRVVPTGYIFRAGVSGDTVRNGARIVQCRQSAPAFMPEEIVLARQLQVLTARYAATFSACGWRCAM